MRIHSIIEALVLLTVLGCAPAQAEDARFERAASGNAGIQWVHIPGGTFSMGSSDEETEGESQSQPVHTVAIKPFEMSKSLVTNKQYKSCVAAGACEAPHFSDGSCIVYTSLLKPGVVPRPLVDKLGTWTSGVLAESSRGDDHPVVCVDWTQAKAFAVWGGGRLPSEAEWEYAARSAGKDFQFPWGHQVATCDKAVISGAKYTAIGCGRFSTWPVCSKPKGNTEQGLCDMAGNVWEWVQDAFHNNYLGAPTDGSSWEGRDPDRINRGGSWLGSADDVRTTIRNPSAPSYRTGDLGFRLAR